MCTEGMAGSPCSSGLPTGLSASRCWVGLCSAEQQPVRKGSSGQHHVGLPRATHAMARQWGGEE